MIQLAGWIHVYSLRIQVCPKKGINPTVLLLGWDWDHQTYSREGYGSLGNNLLNDRLQGVGNRVITRRKDSTVWFFSHVCDADAFVGTYAHSYVCRERFNRAT